LSANDHVCKLPTAVSSKSNQRLTLYLLAYLLSPRRLITPGITIKSKLSISVHVENSKLTQINLCTNLKLSAQLLNAPDSNLTKYFYQFQITEIVRMILIIRRIFFEVVLTPYCNLLIKYLMRFNLAFLGLLLISSFAGSASDASNNVPNSRQSPTNSITNSYLGTNQIQQKYGIDGDYEVSQSGY
jgi:hypothetical protein